MKWNKVFVLAIAVSLSQISFGQKAGKGSDKLVTISGKVRTRDNYSVAKAVFFVDNVSTNTTIKSNGSYKIKVSPSASQLEVRCSGFKSSSAEIKGKTDIDFILEPDQPADLKSGDTLNTVKNNKHKKTPAGPRGKKINTYNNIYQMIQAELSGVTVSGRNIQIRQGHSFYGSSTPLFVVNGVIVPSIANIEPVEVKSISLLKGSAASIYGNDGSNGVIVITLKSGSDR